MLKPQSSGRGKSRPGKVCSLPLLILSVLVVGEALIIARLVHRLNEKCLDNPAQVAAAKTPLRCVQVGAAAAATVGTPVITSLAPEVVDGVAVTLWLGSPKWFQNRYSMMLALVHAWLPPKWKIQVFYHPTNRMALQAINFIGVRKLVDKGAVLLTPLPEDLLKKKRKDILLSKWLWENVSGERVVTFGGTSVFCGNSPNKIEDFAQQLDYIGGPWSAFDGLGGDAGLTYRNRSFMLATSVALAQETGLSRRDTGKEDTEIASYWNDFLVMNRSIPFRLARRPQTNRWAMGDLNDATNLPFGAIGTLGALNEKQRIEAIDFCPELKLFYPVLSHPSCFGAAPKPLDCFKALCETGGLKCEPGSAIVKGKGGSKITLSLS